jgi:kynurenine formamidase
MRFVDLGHPIQTQMPVFPSIMKTFVGVYRSHKENTRPGGVSSQTNIIVMCDHAGTHVDAPIHFNPDGTSIDQMPLDLMVGEAVLLDFTDKKSGDVVTVKDVEGKLKDAGIGPGKINAILFKTGAGPLYGTDKYYQHYLEIHRDTVRWMASCGIKLWGVDASTIDSAPGRETHMLLRELEFYHMENLANLDALPVNVIFTLTCVALPFVGATASPLRPIAILREQN